MPFVLILAGVVLIISAVRNTQQQLFYLLALDFTGPNNFIFWFLSILVIGALGYIPKAKPLSDGFLILVILVLFLKKGQSGRGGGFFEQFQRQISSTTTATPKISTGQNGQSFIGGSSSIINIGGSSGSVSIGNGGISFPSGIGGSFPGGLGFPGGGGDPNNPFQCDPLFDIFCTPSVPSLMG